MRKMATALAAFGIIFVAYIVGAIQAYSATSLTPQEQAYMHAACIYFNTNANAPTGLTTQWLAANCPEVSA